MHVSDWTPTILDFAGIDPTTANPNFNGFSFKDVLQNDADSPREDLFYFLKAQPTAGTYRKGNYKLSFRQVVKYWSLSNHTAPAEGRCVFDNVLEQEGNTNYNDIHMFADTLTPSVYDNVDVVMFDLDSDPYELFNIFDDNAALGEEMIDAIKAEGNL